MTNRNFGLDLLRSCAIIFVLIAHSATFMSNHWSRFILDVTGFFGFIGVEIFFALSGFLVGGIIIKIGDEISNIATVRHFLLMRWFRTLPNYYFYAAIHLIAAYGFQNISTGISNNIGYFIFSQSLLWNHPSFFSEAWSLAIEEWYYLITPILLYILHKLKLKSPLIITMSLMLIIPLLLLSYFATTTENDFPFDFYRKASLIRLDAIVFGMFVYLIHDKSKEFIKQSKGKFFFAGLLLLFIIFYYQFFGGINIATAFYFKTLALSMIPLGGAMMIPFIFYLKCEVYYINQSVKYIALISYSLYLCNLLIHSLLSKYLMSSISAQSSIIAPALVIFLFFSMCIVFANLTYLLIERPFLKLRNNLLH